MDEAQHAKTDQWKWSKTLTNQQKTPTQKGQASADNKKSTLATFDTAPQYTTKAGDKTKKGRTTFMNVGNDGNLAAATTSQQLWQVIADSGNGNG